MVKNRDGGGENNNKDVLLEDLASDGPETCMMSKQQAHCVLVVLSCNPHDCCGRRLAALLRCSCHAAPRKIHEMAVETCMHTSSGLVVSCQMQNFRFSFRRDKRVLATEI